MQNIPSRPTQQTLELAVAEMLVARGKLTAGGMDRALRAREAGEEWVIPILTKLGLVTERDLAQALSEKLDLPLVAAAEFPEAPPLAEQLGANFLRHAKVLPLAETALAMTAIGSILSATFSVDNIAA